MKIALLREPDTGFHNFATGPRAMPLTRCLPYYRSRMGVYIHRVRSGLLHTNTHPIWVGEEGGVLHRVSLRLWCGQVGYLPWKGRSRPGGELFAEPPEHADVCATCEGRAVGAGLPSSVILTNRPIRFSPRGVR